mmetsp:Transcript_44772/g.83641  ORF Transcript_44772/g.83641 Transcript_44772/m.83641 type:complete len:291 (+) Transcript_44772:72-944(+)
MMVQTQTALDSANVAVNSNKDRARYEMQFYKTRQCSFFEKGKCTRGEKCKYAHGTRELQSRPDLTFTSLCRTFTATGVCKDPKCSFAHNPEQLRATNKFYKTSLCKFNLNGRCRLGEECRHAHGEDELQPLPSSKPTREQVDLSAPPGLSLPEKPEASGELSDLGQGYAASLLLNAAAAGGNLAPIGSPWPMPPMPKVTDNLLLEPAFIPLRPSAEDAAAAKLNHLLSAVSMDKSLAGLAGLPFLAGPAPDMSPAIAGRVGSWTTMYSSGSSSSSFEDQDPSDNEVLLQL